MASLLPWADWQFWLVTVLALAGLWFGLRPLLRQRSKPGCSNCKAGGRSNDALVNLSRRSRT